MEYLEEIMDKNLSNVRGEILVVDDGEDSARLLEFILKDAGYVVRTACSGGLGLCQAIANPPDLVLLDVRMPGMDGLEVCRCLKRTPVTASIPVIFISAAYDPADRIAGFDAGGVDFVGKPFVDSEVLARVKTHIDMAILAKDIMRRQRRDGGGNEATRTNLVAPSRPELLIVEDTPDSLQLLSEMFISEGFSVREAPNGELALWSAAKHPPNLVLLDIRMPGMNGYDVCRCLKSDPATSQVPVIFISALSDTEDRERGFDAGAVDYITKPFSENAVIDLVRAHLQRGAANEVAGEAIGSAHSGMAEDQQALHRIKEAFAYSQFAVMFVNKDGRIIYVNPEFVRMTGYDPAYLENMDSSSLFLGRNVLRYRQFGAYCRSSIVRIRTAAEEKITSHISISRVDKSRFRQDIPDFCIAVFGRQSTSPAPSLVWTERLLSNEFGIAGATQADLIPRILHAVSNGEMEVLYQPYFDLVGGQVAGAEAMLQWRHPDLGALSESRFLATAEETGDIVPMGILLLSSICEQLGTCHSNLLDGFTVRMKLCSLQFWQDSLPFIIQSALKNNGVPSRFLELEISVETLMEDQLQGNANLRRLQDLGVTLALSVKHLTPANAALLSRLQIARLKIDQALLKSASGYEIKTLLDAAHNRQVKVVASGIADERQLSLIQAYRYDYAQGDFLSPSMTDVEFIGRCINVRAK